MISDAQASGRPPRLRARALEPPGEPQYHLDMITLLKAIGRLFGMTKEEPDPGEAGEEDDSIDPRNPFPEPVTLEFRDVLDLHSIPPRQVRAVVEDYLQEAHQRGLRWVRIIHGKGIGVQRDIVRSILARTPYVAEFTDAPPEAGGWGATLVTFGEK